MHSVNNHFDAQSGRPPRLGASISGLCKTSLVTPKPHLSNRQPAREKVKAKEGNEEDRFATFFDPNPGLMQEKPGPDDQLDKFSKGRGQKLNGLI